MSTAEYVAASWAGMLPGTFAYVYLGSVGRQTLSAAGGATDPLQLALYGVCFTLRLLLFSPLCCSMHTPEGAVESPVLCFVHCARLCCFPA